jgi:hypothetical protein
MEGNIVDADLEPGAARLGWDIIREDKSSPAPAEARIEENQSWKSF